MRLPDANSPEYPYLYNPMAMKRDKRSENGEAVSTRLSLRLLREAGSMISFLKPYRWYFFGGLALLFFGSLLFMIFPYLAGDLADVATGNGKLGLDLNQIGLILIVILILQGLLSYLRVIWFAVVSEKGMVDVRNSNLICPQYIGQLSYRSKFI